MKAMKLGASSGLDLPLLTSFAIGAQLLSMYIHTIPSLMLACVHFRIGSCLLHLKNKVRKPISQLRFYFVVPIHRNFLKWHIEKADMGWD